MIGNYFFSNSGAAAYQIEQSLRFDGSSYLSRTPSSSGSRTTWTVSCWVKRAKLGTAQYIWSAGTSNVTYLNFQSDDSLKLRNGSGSVEYVTNWKFRDPSAWYHIVVKWDTTNGTQADRAIIYVNGVALTTGDYSQYDKATASENSSGWNTNVVHAFGHYTYNSSYKNEAYLSEVHFVDGTALGPTSFGELDNNGVWRPIAYSGSYGTNGFYLKFDPSATNGIGHDHSGNGNNWTPSGFTTNSTFPDGDVVYDTPTKNFPVINPVDPVGGTHTNFSLIEGNLAANRTGGAGGYTCATFYIPANTPKFYVELKNRYASGSQVGVVLGLDGDDDPSGGTPQSGFFNNTRRLMYRWNGATTQVPDPPGNILGANSIVQLAVDLPNGKLWVGVNNTWYQDANTTGGNPSAGTGASDTTLDTTRAYKLRIGSASTPGYANGFWANFGQQDFAYTPPTGFEGLSTALLPAPDIADGSKNFDSKLYQGNEGDVSAPATQTITGLNFAPDFVWIKCRNSGTANNSLFDRVRGTGKTLWSNSTSSEQTDYTRGYLSAFTSDGFTVRAGSTDARDVNGLGSTGSPPTQYVAWNWLAGGSGSSNTAGSITSTVSANASAGFSIVSYTAQNAVRTIGHGLGVAPGLIIVKNRDVTQNWAVYHKSLGATKALYLDIDIKQDLNSGYWNDTEPTSTVFTVGTNTRTGGTTNNYVAYCFAEVEGFSKFSTYQGNGNTNGAFCFTGFTPAWVMVKTYAGGSQDSWYIWDSKSDPYNFSYHYLRADATSAQNTDTTNAQIDILSNGFKIRQSSANINENGSYYVFIAFAENPFGGDGVSPATAR